MYNVGLLCTIILAPIIIAMVCAILTKTYNTNIQDITTYYDNTPYKAPR